MSGPCAPVHQRTTSKKRFSGRAYGYNLTMTRYTACLFVCWQDIENQQSGGEVFPAACSGPGYKYCVKMWCRAGFMCTPAQSVGGVNTTLHKQGRGQLYDIIPIWFDEVKCLKFRPQKTQKQLHTISHMRNHLRKLGFLFPVVFDSLHFMEQKVALLLMCIAVRKKKHTYIYFSRTIWSDTNLSNGK